LNGQTAHGHRQRDGAGQKRPLKHATKQGTILKTLNILHAETLHAKALLYLSGLIFWLEIFFILSEMLFSLSRVS
jgi:hypothetical protein